MHLPRILPPCDVGKNLLSKSLIHSNTTLVKNIDFPCDAHYSINDKGLLESQQHTQTKPSLQTFIYYLLLDQDIDRETLVKRQQQNLTEPLLHDSFAMCCFIMLSRTKFSFKVSNILKHNVYKNYSFAFCCSMIVSTISFSFRIRNIMKRNVGKIYSFDICCFIMSSTRTLSLKSAIYSNTIFL